VLVVRRAVVVVPFLAVLALFFAVDFFLVVAGVEVVSATIRLSGSMASVATARTWRNEYIGK
jgi:hypothetical protein